MHLKQQFFKKIGKNWDQETRSSYFMAPCNEEECQEVTIKIDKFRMLVNQTVKKNMWYLENLVQVLNVYAIKIEN